MNGDISNHYQVPYVGQTDHRHLITHFKEHRDRSAGPVAMLFADCDLKVKDDDAVILGSTNKSEPLLYTLEALFVRELKPFINTQLKMTISQEN